MASKKNKRYKPKDIKKLEKKLLEGTIKSTEKRLMKFRSPLEYGGPKR